MGVCEGGSVELIVSKEVLHAVWIASSNLSDSKELKDKGRMNSLLVCKLGLLASDIQALGFLDCGVWSSLLTPVTSDPGSKVFAYYRVRRKLTYVC